MNIRDAEEAEWDAMATRLAESNDDWIVYARSDRNRTIDTHVIWAVKYGLASIHKNRYRRTPHIQKLLDEARAAVHALSQALWADHRLRMQQWKERHGRG